MLAGESATTIARSPAGWSSACSIASIPPHDWPTTAYRSAIPSSPRELDELVLEELRRPEVGRRVGQVLALAAAELVVEDAARGRTGSGRRSARSSRAPRRGRRGRSRPASRARRRARRRRGTTSRGRPRSSVPSASSQPPRSSGRVAERMVAGREVAVAVRVQRGPLDAADVGRIRGSADGSGSRSAGRSGSAPRPRARSARAARLPSASSVSIAGIAESSASVYGWIGRAKSSSDRRRARRPRRGT